MPSPTPNRWLHLRLPRAFTPQEEAAFAAQAKVFEAYVEATLAAWTAFGYAELPPRYAFFPVELSDDRTTATLPLGGDWTLRSRALFESGASYLLWQHFPLAFLDEAEEGLTEEHGGERETHWRRLARSTPHPEAQLAEVGEAHEHPSVLDTARRALWWVSGIVPRA